MPLHIAPQMPVRSAIDLLTSTLQGPMPPNICCVRISIAADRIDQELDAQPTLVERIKFAKSLPQFLRTGIRFLTMHHAPKPHIEMINKQFVSCRCNLKDPAVLRQHTPSRPRPDGRAYERVDALSLLYDVINTICGCITLAVSDRAKHHFRSSSTNGIKNWPRDPNDLLPAGPENTIKALSLWTQAPPLGYSIFTLAGSLALFYSQFAKDLLASRNHIFALALPIKHIREAIAFYDKSIAPNKFDPFIPSHVSSFQKPLTAVFGLFDDLKRTITFEFTIMVTDHGHWFTDSLTRLAAILPTIPGEWSKKLLAQTHFLTPMSICRANPILGLTLGAQQWLTPAANTPERAFEHIVSVRKVGCLNIKCTTAEEAIHLKNCKQCELMRFCNEKCYKEAWRSLDLPHKAICPEMDHLKKSLGEDWDSLFTPGYTFRQFQALCREKNVDMDLVQKVGNSIGALKGAKMRFRAKLEDPANYDRVNAFTGVAPLH
ncbi:hypothetical protein D9613_011698 [Agrocybe pediades]|uniref:MYND-type domain-containing protein n=1 Tax=Agrocybe pediades TaxID=84607 RepID=A0A8H4QX69_9AGAR|nr:hypothetical protein D9613_011698 [Agrocybe pediades]